MTQNIDVCIVGAGPAGATTSLFLSKMGISHLILEKDSFPRDKICGDALDLKVMRVLNQLDPNSAYELLSQTAEFSPSWGMSLIAPNGKRKDLEYTPQSDGINFPIFCVAKRADFDHFLAKKIPSPYANFQENAEVKNLERRDGGMFITYVKGGETNTVFSKLVVGADGDHSVVLRKLDERKIDRRHYVAALRQYWTGIEGIHPRGLLEIYFPKSLPMSYFWIFPLPNGEANVGYGMASFMISRKKINLKEQLNYLLTQDPVLAPRFKNAVPLEKPQGWGLPLASKRRQNYGDNYLLVGDAGSLICPTTGEGIGTGMMSGYIAAHYIQKAIEKQDFSAKTFRTFHRESHRRLEGDILNYQILLRTFPEYWQVPVVNLLLNFSSSMLKSMPSWLETAFKKDIDIQFD